MKKTYAAALLLCLLFSFSKSAHASHLVGSDISYECTGTPGVYKITLILYRDCSGIPLCTGGCGAACTQTMSIKGADPSCSNSTFGSFDLSLISIRDYDIKPTCPTSKNTCDNMGCATPGTFTPSTERYEFQGFVNIGQTSGIPASCCNVRFSYELCCRNSSINTGAADQNFYIDAVVNRCLSVSPCNSSPKFTTEPYDIVCGGQSVLYNNGTIEPDRDSLSFEFTPALLGFGSSVTYDPPFAYNKPLPWSGAWNSPFPGGIRCDPTTGDIMFTPGNISGSNFYGIIAILVKQWKTVNGVPTVIGITRRDIQMVVGANCLPNNPPIITTIPPDTGISGLNPKLSWEVCEGSQLCFDVVSRDRDTNSTTLISDTTYLQWDSALASLGATFTPNYVDSTRKINGPREASYKFCWTPAIGTASNIPYIVVFKNNDSKCPIPGRNARGFSIKVRSIPAITITKTNLNCGKFKLAYTNPTPANPVDSVKWKIAKAPFDYTFASGADTFGNIVTTPNLYFGAPGKYLIQLTLKNSLCTKVKYDTLLVDTFVQAIAMNDTFVCNGNTLALTAITKYGKSPYSYRWFNNIKDSALNALNAPAFTTASFNVTPTASKTYTIQVRDSSGCRAYDSVYVRVNKGSKNTVVKNVTCNGLNNGSITLNMLDTLMPFQYRINGGTFQSSNLFTGLTPGTYAVEAKDSNNCSIGVAGLIITQPTLLRDTLTKAIPETCKGFANGDLTTYAIGGTSPYRYSMDSIVFNGFNSYSNLAPATYKIHILDNNNCYAFATGTIAPADSLYHLTAVLNPTCFGKNNGEIRTQGKGGNAPYTYRLGTIGAYNNDSVYENLVANTYTISVKDKNACTITFTKTITQPTKLFSTSQKTDASCFGITDGAATVHTTGGVKPYQYRNGINGVLTSDSVFTNLAAGNYTFYTVDNVACLDSVKITINQPLQTVATLIPQHPSCFQKEDGQITASVSQGKSPFVYALDNGSFGITNTFTHLAGNNYSVTIKDSMGCMLTLATTLITPPQIVAGTITGNSTVIQNIAESYSITPQTDLNYTWGIQKGTILSGQNTASVSVNWDSIGVGGIGVVVYSDSTCGDTATLMVNIGVNGLSELAKTFGLQVYPNPSSGLVNITLQKLPAEHSLKLYDIQGKLLIEQELKLSQQLNLESLPQGMYMLKIGEWRGQVIKK